MTTANDARKAHKILDDLIEGNIVLDEEREFLRRSLPELPKQKTLEELIEVVESAQSSYVDGDWLVEIHTQLKGLADVKPVAVPALPAGMRLADHEEYGRVVVSPATDPTGRYPVFRLTDSYVSGADVIYIKADTLKFIDAESAKPAHPEFRETEVEYGNAPVGTVVARDNGLPWVKEKSNYWTRPDAAKSDYGMSLGSRRVLRWGWGE